MCPDRQIISLYADRELPSPWKEKIESHLASCRDCRSRLDGYRRLRNVLLETPRAQEDAVKAAQDRVWARLESRDARKTLPFILGKPEKRAGWRRTVSLPVPAAAAAAAIFVAAALLAVRGFVSPAQQVPYEQVSGIGADLQGIVSVTDMDGILQYLSSQESGNYWTMRLPENSNFSSYGEPSLVRAADYSGRTDRR